MEITLEMLQKSPAGFLFFTREGTPSCSPGEWLYKNLPMTLDEILSEDRLMHPLADAILHAFLPYDNWTWFDERRAHVYDESRSIARDRAEEFTRRAMSEGPMAILARG